MAFIGDAAAVKVELVVVVSVVTTGVAVVD